LKIIGNILSDTVSVSAGADDGYIHVLADLLRFRIGHIPRYDCFDMRGSSGRDIAWDAGLMLKINTTWVFLQ
jgi:hypothetical protein